MKKNLAPAISLLLLLSFFLLLGMGDMGGTAPGSKIPTPEKNFSVVVVDRLGVTTTLSQFSQEGKASLMGKRGKGTITVPFEKITAVQFQTMEGNQVMTSVSLRENKSIEISIDKSAKFFGKADFGSFHIEGKDLKSIRFQN